MEPEGKGPKKRGKTRLKKPSGKEDVKDTPDKKEEASWGIPLRDLKKNLGCGG